jgi:hypothetical protein
MPITTKVVSSNPVYGEVYSIQHYVIKFVSDLRQVSGFLQVTYDLCIFLNVLQDFLWTLNFCRFWPIMQIRKKGGWN